MSAVATFHGMAEVTDVLVGGPGGVLHESTLAGADGESLASETAVIVSALEEAGTCLGFERLELLSVRGPAHASLTACRPRAFLTVLLDPARSTAQVERALGEWTPPAAPAPAPARSPEPSPSNGLPPARTRARGPEAIEFAPVTSSPSLADDDYPEPEVEEPPVLTIDTADLGDASDLVDPTASSPTEPWLPLPAAPARLQPSIQAAQPMPTPPPIPSGAALASTPPLPRRNGPSMMPPPVSSPATPALQPLGARLPSGPPRPLMPRLRPPPGSTGHPRTAPGDPVAPPPRSAADEAPAQSSVAVAYARFRRCVVRGLLSEAALRSRQILETYTGDQGHPGCESMGPERHEAATRILLEGVGSILAGDCIDGLGRLKDMTEPSTLNQSFRWLALYWSVRASTESGYVAGAMSLAVEALSLSEKLDEEARAVSLLARAPALGLQGKPGSALAQLGDARKLFHALLSNWGVAQTWLAEARILASLDQEPQAAEAARQARAADRSWDEPQLFLVRRALMRGEIDEADRALGALDTPGAERERSLIAQIRRGAVSPEDAADFVRQRDTTPSAQAARVLERIARSSPRFVEARAELAWMLLKLGKYASAGDLFRSLLSLDLSSTTRASLMVGLGCIANARDKERRPEARMRAALSPVPPPEPAPAALLPLPSASLLTEEMRSSDSRRLGVFSGELAEFALPDLLEFLRSGRRTGLLICSARAGVGALSLRRGHVTGGASPATPHIGRLLLEARAITEAALRSAIARQSNEPDRLLGAMLVHEGLVDGEVVRAVLKRQIDMAIREMVLWKEGQFTFANDTAVDGTRATIDVEVDPQVILLNIFKQIDEDNRDEGAGDGGL